MPAATNASNVILPFLPCPLSVCNEWYSTSSTPTRSEPLKDIQLLVIIVGTAWTGKVLPHQRDPAAVHGLRCNLHPQNDRAHRDTSRRCQHPSRATMQFRRRYSMRLEVGHLTLVDVETPRV